MQPYAYKIQADRQIELIRYNLLISITSFVPFKGIQIKVCGTLSFTIHSCGFFNLIGEKVIQKASQTLFLQEIITVTGELSLFHKVQISTQMMNFHSLFMDFFNYYYF